VGKPIRSVRPDRQQLTGCVEDRTDVGVNPWETLARNYLVNHARQVAIGELAKAARRDVFYVNLMSDPSSYRGEPIHLTGRLHRLIQFEAPKGLWNDGIKTLYEAWINPTEKDPSTVYCVVLTEKPALDLAEKFDPAPYVSCDAFFFKIYRYAAKKDAKDLNKRVWRDAPLFMGRTLALATAPKPPEEADSPLAGTLIPGVMIAISLLIALFFGLTWWFRRGDRKVQKRIREARHSEFVAPTDQSVNESSQAIQPESTHGGIKPSGN
jgi:hypothetical protein